MMLALIYILLFCSCFLFVGSIFSSEKMKLSLFLTTLCFSIGLSLGIGSCLFFVSTVLFDTTQLPYFWIELPIAFVLFVVAVLKTKNNLNFSFAKHEPNFLKYVGSGLFVTFFILTWVKSLKGFSAEPHGNWDAWAIWNSRARLLVRSAGDWKNAFSNDIAWGHPDYPLFLQASVANMWKLIGHESLKVPGFLSIASGLLIVTLIFSSLSFLQSTILASIISILFFKNVLFLKWINGQYADMWVAFFYLSAGVSVTLFCKSPSQKKSLILTGLFAGFGAWTKNEGMIFVGVLSCLVLVCVWLRSHLSAILFYLGGLVPGLSCLAYFKTFLAPINDMVEKSSSAQVISHLSNPARYPKVIDAFSNYFGTFKNEFFILLGFLVCSLVIKKLTSFGQDLQERNPELQANTKLAAFGSGAGVMLAYMLIFVVTPQEQQWHLDTASDRLFFQAIPILLWSCVLLIPLNWDVAFEHLENKLLKRNTRSRHL